jgi:nitroreductase/NAD-dependent dihydropyrimidine dehydrogenase PreA subunit
MKIVGIDKDKCNGCGLCERECAANRITVSNVGAAEYNDPEGWCTGCGHCVAVCPQDAVIYEGEETAREVKGDGFAFEDIRDLLLSKRSVRWYSDKDVSDKDIGRILEAIRSAPSGHNAQTCEYAVVKDPQIRKMLSDAVIESFRSFKTVVKLRMLLKPFISKAFFEYLNDPGTASGIDAMISEYEAGKDNICFNAPAVILVHVPDMGGLSYVDPAIAFTYGMLAAHGLGIGSCWMGFIMITLKKHKKILKNLNIEKGSFIAGAMSLGYPLHAYRRVPVRNPLKAEWF